jgi:hypothetical protein
MQLGLFQRRGLEGGTHPLSQARGDQEGGSTHPLAGICPYCAPPLGKKTGRCMRGGAEKVLLWSMITCACKGARCHGLWGSREGAGLYLDPSPVTTSTLAGKSCAVTKLTFLELWRPVAQLCMQFHSHRLGRSKEKLKVSSRPSHVTTSNPGELRHSPPKID